MSATRSLLAGLLLTSSLACSACQTASLVDIAPQADAAQPAAEAASTAPVEIADTTPSGGPVRTGAYPNLNLVPKPEAPQLTNAERNAKVAELNAARQRQTVKSGGGARPNDIARLRRLGQSHGDEVLKEIEGE
jgi:hypothetical protein